MYVLCKQFQRETLSKCFRNEFVFSFFVFCRLDDVERKSSGGARP